MSLYPTSVKYRKKRAKRLCEFAYAGQLHRMCEIARFFTVNENHLSHSALLRASMATDFANDRARFLLRRGADVNVRDAGGNSSFHWAAFMDNSDLVKLLHQHDPRAIDAQNFKGDTPLIVAVRADSFRAAIELVKLGADLSLRNRLGMSAFDVAKWLERANFFCVLSGDEGE